MGRQARPPSRWRFGLVGVGRGSGYGRLLSGTGECEVVACCDASHQALGKFQRELELPDSRCFTDYGSFISAVPMDAVFLGTPISAHADQTVKALEAGVNVLCEVTAASTVEDCGRIVEAVRRTGSTYMMAENCCYWHFVMEWKELVQSGRLGEVFYSECEYLHPLPEMMVDRETGEYRWRAERPPLHYCSHSLGPILEITHDRITRAMGMGQGHKVAPEHRVVGAIDIQVGLFETERGALIKLLRTSIAPRRPHIHYYMLQATRGFVETDRKGPYLGHLYLADEMETAQEIACPQSDPSLPESASAGGHGTSEYLLLQDFLKAMATGEKPVLNEVRAMDLTVPGIIAHQSAMRGGIWMDVPSFE
jgi:predicted dehydrogenase